MSFITFTIIGVSVANIVVNSTIFAPISEWIIGIFKIGFIEKLLNCMMCFGFWVGFFLSLWFGINPLIGALTISLFSHLYGMIAYSLEAISNLTTESVEE